MSRLEELIKELCPDGVEYKELEAIATIKRGERITKKQIKEIGNYKVISGGVSPMGYFDEYNRDENTITISSYGAAGYVGYQLDKFWANDVCLCVYPKVLVDNKYLYYALTSQQDYIYSNTTKAIPDHIPTQFLNELQIPVPPLEVQREIVRILDNFTSLTAELTAELTARKKQYEYYRDSLLSFEKTGGARRVKLGEIATIKNGKDYKHLGEGEYPVYGSGGIMTYVDSYAYNKPSVLIPRKGSLSNLFYVDKPFWNVDTIFYTEIDEASVVPKYLYYTLSKEHLEKLNTAGGVPSLTQAILNEVQLSIPSLEIQNKIVSVLDNFDAICSDFNIGLPAEIEARKKQYEYYRDLLLSFDYSQTVNVERERAGVRRTDEIRLLQFVFGYAFVSLGEVSTIIRGGNFQKKDFVENGLPCIHYGQMYTHFGVHTNEPLKYVSKEVFDKSKTASKNDIVMAVTSENVEDVCKCTAWLGEDDIAVSGHTAIIKHNQNAKYLSYYFHSEGFFNQKRKLAHGTKVIEVTPDSLKGIIIPLPSLSEQERIVNILDRFDSLCNDISSGLPAEIEARKKQYEYYRDKLLSFN